jgi:hypothetical protein
LKLKSEEGTIWQMQTKQSNKRSALLQKIVVKYNTQLFIQHRNIHLANKEQIKSEMVTKTNAGWTVAPLQLSLSEQQ